MQMKGTVLSGPRFRPVLLGLTLLSGCAAGPDTQPPGEGIAAAELALERAQEANAREYAPLEVRLARDKLERAKELAREGDDGFAEARRLAEEAKVDARLAEAKARTAETRKRHEALKGAVEVQPELGQETGGLPESPTGSTGDAQ